MENKKMIIGRIYKLISSECEEVYIGSTTQLLQQRLFDHKKDYKRYNNGQQNYITSFKIAKYTDVKIQLIFESEFESVKEMHKLEGEYIKNTENCVNKQIAGRNIQEYRENNKDKIKDRDKKYRETNKDKIKETLQNYYKNNKDKIKETVKNYKENNKDKIKEQASTKITCHVCEVIYSHGDRARHCRSQRHQLAMKAIEEPELA